MDRVPSADTVGRYYDAFPLNAKDKPDLLVSWADGPVESGVLGEECGNLLKGFFAAKRKKIAGEIRPRGPLDEF